MHYDAVTIALVAATFLLAGIVKGVTGMGLPTVAMGVLGALASPLAAAGLLLLPSAVTNVWQLAAGPRLGTLARRLWPMMAGILAGTVGGAALLAGGSARWTTMTLGIVLAGYAAHALLARPLVLSPRHERWASPLVGLATGFLTGATGVFVVPAVPYIQAMAFERDELVQALALSFTVSTAALALGLAWHGALPVGGLAASALAVVPALAGMAIGQAIRTRISPPVFRRVFLVCLGLLGVEMALRPLL